jgi:ABC-2 type transport system ATP-binding protein
LLIGLRTPKSGHLIYPDDKQPCIAWVPQEYAFYPELSCLENLQLFASLLDIDAHDRQRRIASAMANCQLQEFAKRRARHCSGGVRRRLNLAIALLQQPDVLLLDEPTVGVDPQSRAFLLERVRELVQGGTAVLYASHYMEEISAVCSNIVLLDRGQVIAHGELSTLLQGPAGGPSFADLDALFMHYTHRSLRD